jgi:hypothetical protein
LANGGSATITLTAVTPSSVADDVGLFAYCDGQAAGSGKETNEIVTLPAHIRAPDTPAEMGDRIPDVNPTSFYVGLSVPLTGTGEMVMLVVNNQSAANGTVAFIGSQGESAELEVTASTNFELVGEDQTQPTADGQAGNAFKLQLAAQVAAAQVVMVNAFSVAPIPVSVTATTATPMGANDKEAQEAEGQWWWGVKYELTVQSDGGKLSSVQISENMQFVNGTGKFEKGEKKSTDGEWFDAIGTTDDWNGVGPLYSDKSHDDAVTSMRKNVLTTASESDWLQLIRYYDSNITEKPKDFKKASVIKKSGFSIVIAYPVKQAANGLGLILVTRKGAAVVDGKSKADAGLLDKGAAGEKEVGV